MGFAEQLQEIIGRLPGGHQTVLFSATLPKLLVEFARAGEGGSCWGWSWGWGLGTGMHDRSWGGACPSATPDPSSPVTHRRPH